MSKFGNKPTSVDGKSFPSKLEANRYSELRLLEKAGKIKNLQTQVTYRLEVAGNLICKYIADFVYTTEHGLDVVEDTKSPATVTSEYRIKEKLMKACLDIEVQRVYRDKVGGGGKRRWGR